MPEPAIRPARPEDVPAVEALLAVEWLPSFSLADFIPTMWVAELAGNVVGCAGLEIYDDTALLRSVVVAPSLRGTRLGDRLTLNALDEARSRGALTLYLFTMHAAPFFARVGFERCTMDDFEPAARQCTQYRALLEHPEIAKQLTAMRLVLT